MSYHFYKLTIDKIIRETTDCVKISFRIPDEYKDMFNFHSGQYLNLKLMLNNEEIRRSYSICSAPFEEGLSVAVKKITGGKFSTYANAQLKEGDAIEVMPPMGNFTLPSKMDGIKTVVFYCAGSGITPVLSLVKTILYQHPSLRVVVYYGNRHTDSIIFREELENLKNLFTTRFTLHYILSKERLSSDLFYGRINGEKCRVFEKYFSTDKTSSLYYLCGPSEMIFDVKAALEEQGIEEKNIHFELFSTSGIPAQEIAAEQTIEKIKSRIVLQLDGLTQDIEFESHHESILDAALANGADLPFACKGGVCSTCKARCEDGAVTMKLNYALEPDEVEAGYILTCQSIPKTESVFINFDY